MDPSEIATRLLARTIELARSYKVSPSAKKPLPPYNDTSKIGRAGSDSDGDGGASATTQDNPPDPVINPDQFNKPRTDSDVDLDEVGEVDVSTDRPQHNGSMVAFFLEPTIAQRLAANDASAANDERHITVAYLPEGAPPEVDHVVNVLAAQSPPFHGLITGTDSFPPDEESEFAVYAKVEVPGLQAFRADLVERLSTLGVPVARPDSFVPHVTLRYYQEGEVPPPHQLDHGAAPIPIRLSRITVSRAGSSTHFPLRGDS